MSGSDPIYRVFEDGSATFHSIIGGRLTIGYNPWPSAFITYSVGNYQEWVRGKASSIDVMAFMAISEPLSTEDFLVLFQAMEVYSG